MWKPETGTIIRGYRLDKIIVESEKCAVYRAYNDRKKEAIVKLYSEALSKAFSVSDEEQAKKAFLKITDIEGLSEIFDYGVINDRFFVIRECVEGIGLNAIVDFRLPLNMVISILRQGAVALTRLHSVGLLHRSLSLSNFIVRVTNDGLRLTITDISICSFPRFQADNKSVLSELTTHYHYRAPELLIPGGESIASEVYALGIILFEMLTGYVPFSASTYHDAMIKHQEEPVPSLRAKFRAEKYEGLNLVLSKALRKVVWDRYFNVEDFAENLSDIRTYDESNPTPELIAMKLNSPFYIGSGKSQAPLVSDQDETRISASFKELSVKKSSQTLSGAKPLSIRLGESNHKIASDAVQSKNRVILGISNSGLYLSGATPLKAWENEINTLRNGIESAIQGKGGIYMLCGKNGIGKSSIIEVVTEEFSSSENLRVYKILFEDSDSSNEEKNTDFCNFFNEILGCANIETSALKDYFTYKFKDLHTVDFVTIDDLISFLRPFDGKDTVLTNNQLIELISTICTEHPIVLIMEQIHFADERALQLIEILAAELSVRKRALTLIASYEAREIFETSKAHDILLRLVRFEGNSITTLRMSPLSDTSMTQFITENLNVDQRLASVLVEHSDGIPKMAIQILRKNIIERNVKKNKNGVYGIEFEESWNSEYPEAILIVQKKFIDKAMSYLPDDIDKSYYDAILRRLAVLGDAVEDDLIDAYFRGEDNQELLDVLDEALENLLKVGLLRECQLNGKTALAFESRFVREAVIRSHSLRKLRPLHKIAAQVKPKYYKNMNLRQYEAMVEHFEHIADPSHALLMKYHAFNRAAAAFDFNKIVVYGKDLMAIFDNDFIRNSGKNLEDFFQPINFSHILSTLAIAFTFMDMIDRSAKICDKMYYVAEKFSSDLLRFRASLMSFLQKFSHRDYNESYEKITKIIRYFEGAREYSDLVRAYLYAILLSMKHDRYSELESYLKRLKDILSDKSLNNKASYEAFTGMVLAYVASENGRFDEAMVYTENARILFDSVNLKSFACIANTCSVIFKMHLGRLPVSTLDRNVLVRKSGNFSFEIIECSMLLQLSLLYHYHGGYEECEALLKEIERLAVRADSKKNLAETRVRYAFLYYVTTEYSRCIEKLDQAFMDFLKLKNISRINEVLWGYICCALLADDYERCERYIETFDQLHTFSMHVDTKNRIDAVRYAVAIRKVNDTSVFDLIETYLEQSENSYLFEYSQYFIIPAIEKAALFDRMDLILSYFDRSALLEKAHLRSSVTQFARPLSNILRYFEGKNITDDPHVDAVHSGLTSIHKMITETCYALKKNIAALQVPQSMNFTYIDSIIGNLTRQLDCSLPNRDC